MKQYKKTVFKMMIIAVMAFLLLRNIDAKEVLRYLMDADWKILCPAFFLLCFHCVILALKWKVLLVSTGFRSLLGGVLVSHVVTCSIGGQLAGEGGKILFLRQSGENMGMITASVFVDKLTGLLGVFVVGFFGMLLSDGYLPDRYRVIYCIVVMCCSCVISGLFRKNTLHIFGIFSGIIRKRAGIWTKAGTLLDDMLKAVGRFADHKKMIGHSIVWGIVQQTVSAFSCYLICAAMGIDIGFGELCWIQSLTSVISLIPLSVMGLGASQISVISFMMLVGITRESAAGYSLVLYMMQLGVAALAVIILMSGTVKD